MVRIGTWLMAAALSGAAWAQQGEPARTLACGDQGASSERARFCEMRETTLAATGRLEVDGGANGGVSVKGWSKQNVLVRAKVEAQAESEAQAKSLVGQVRVLAAGSQVRAEGPDSARKQGGWSVSYEVFVPNRTDLELRAHNGGIHLEDVRGQIRFTTVNGGVHLARLAGAVRGQTTNGGLHIELNGNRWDGEELDASTTNGGVTMSIPEAYSARLETGTVNGGLVIGFPVTAQGDMGKSLSVTLGSGGAPVRAKTINGGVVIRRL